MQRIRGLQHKTLGFELINVRRVESILRQHLDQLELPIGLDAPVIPIESRFLRSAESFSHPPTQESDHE